MPKSLGDREDVQASREATDGRAGRNYVKIPDGKTPWYLMSIA